MLKQLSFYVIGGDEPQIQTSLRTSIQMAAKMRSEGFDGILYRHCHARRSQAGRLTTGQSVMIQRR
ncbi:hypothetical protein GFL49_25900 [Rhizobium leguminosarum bv. viciae]|nr:hypothetical protein [Rhizobium leguminosarum bv. viciae]